MFENPRRGRQARNFTTNAPKILDLKSSSEQIFSRKLPLGAPERYLFCSWKRCSQKREKGTFLAVGSDVLKSAKKLIPLVVFSSHGKPFRILLIDRCQLFGVILMNFFV